MEIHFLSSHDGFRTQSSLEILLARCLKSNKRGIDSACFSFCAFCVDLCAFGNECRALGHECVLNSVACN